MYGTRNSAAIGVSGHVTLTSSGSSLLRLLLDMFPNAALAYSVARKLDTDYTGSAFRVRRSSDNSELDIGFADDVLDQSALTAFVGTGNGFVTTLYDNSGNGRNATQVVAANQPRIVNAGVIETQNGKPAMVFNGVTSYFDLTSALGIFRNVGYAYGFAVMKMDSTSSSTSIAYTFSSASATASRFACAPNVSGNTIRVTARILETDAITSRDSTTNHNGVLVQHTAVARYLDDTIQSIINGTGLGTTALAGTAGPTGDQDSALGYIGRNLTGGNYLPGRMCELVMYNTDQDTKRATIESNQMSFYGIS